jgi:hypothetical protein
MQTTEADGEMEGRMVRAWRSVAVGYRNSTSSGLLGRARRVWESGASEEMTAMEPQTRMRVVGKVGVLAAAFLLALGPGAAWADCTLPDGTAVNGTVLGVLTETVERIDPVNDDAEVHRVATAKEVGTLTVGCGTSLASLVGPIKVQPALSDVLLAPATDPRLNTGPITGSVKFFRSGNALKGTLTGTLDFNPALVGGMPFVKVSGEWSVANLSLQGGFVGVALLPVPAANLGGACLAATGFCYVDVTGALTPEGVVGAIVPLTVSETQPAPAAKFIVTLFN